MATGAKLLRLSEGIVPTKDIEVLNPKTITWLLQETTYDTNTSSLWLSWWATTKQKKTLRHEETPMAQLRATHSKSRKLLFTQQTTKKRRKIAGEWRNVRLR